jgi:hypothetical protein
MYPPSLLYEESFAVLDVRLHNYKPGGEQMNTYLRKIIDPAIWRASGKYGLRMIPRQ